MTPIALTSGGNGSSATNGNNSTDAVHNPSLQVTADHRILIAPSPTRAPLPHEVLVHVKTTGVCGSDIHFWKTGRIGPLCVESNCVLGHEGAGVIVGVGSASGHLFSPGDRVAIEPGVPCGECFLCDAGRYNLCEAVAFSGVYPHEGTLQRFKCHPAKWVHKLPENMTYAQGALLEPLSVVLQGLKSAQLSVGRPALITGAGPIGMIALAAARASGAHPLIITDIEPSRLAFAKKFVPGCQTYQVRKDWTAAQNADAIRNLFGACSLEKKDGESPFQEYKAPHTVLECTGVESSVITAAYACRRGGILVVIGVGKSIMNNLPFMHISLAEIKMLFINRYNDTWPAGINALSGGVINLDPLVTHTFPLGQAVEGLHLAGDPSKGSIKVQILDEPDATEEEIRTIMS